MNTLQVVEAVPLMGLLSMLMCQAVFGEAHPQHGVLLNESSLRAIGRIALTIRTGRRIHLQLASPVAPWPVRLATSHIADNPCLSRRRDRSPSTSVDC